jgi:hypothetical protein
VSHGLSHGVGAGSTNAMGVEIDLGELDRAVRAELADDRVRRHQRPSTDPSSGRR